ncbi:MAG: MarR family transcriptional regulator [Acutalibacter sp.]|jgi:MarR family transcriptional repressor of emrRAB|nr:MarR family transcriptional regulator [Acutalibacter sp.]
MTYASLLARFSSSRPDQQKAIFSTLFIAGNKLQTLFDSHIPQVSLKQFMLLSLVRQAKPPLSLTRLGSLLGCSRQNVKKLAAVLEQKGFLSIRPDSDDPRAVSVRLTEQGEHFFQVEFAAYQGELDYLFQVYSEQEVETLFQLMSKLYEGIERLTEKINQEANHEPDSRPV